MAGKEDAATGGRPHQIDAIPAKGLWRLVARDRLLLAALVSTVAVSIAAVVLQNYDIWISAVFYEPGNGFPISRDPFFRGVRTLGRVLPGIIVAALFALAVGRIARGRPWPQLSDRALAFLALSFAIGPGLIVNLGLKTHWGRARPIATDVFGGQYPFTPAWWPFGGCTANCSFVSGEASTAIILVAFAFVAPKAWRLKIVAFSILWTILISMNRVAFGAHYFSDVMIACGLTLCVVFALKALLLNPEAKD